MEFDKVPVFMCYFVAPFLSIINTIQHKVVTKYNYIKMTQGWKERRQFCLSAFRENSQVLVRVPYFISRF
jgi:hypothetical protein